MPIPFASVTYTTSTVSSPQYYYYDVSTPRPVKPSKHPRFRAFEEKVRALDNALSTTEKI